jgi:CheY-like chemotaxis protein
MARGDLDGIHVLVVEDNDDSRDMLRLALEQCGAFVWARRDGGGRQANPRDSSTAHPGY